MSFNAFGAGQIKTLADEPAERALFDPPEPMVNGELQISLFFFLEFDLKSLT